MNRKQHTVERCHTSSLRTAVERELNGAKENWQQDESHYAFCGGGFPIIVNNEFFICGSPGFPALFQDPQV